MAAVAVSPLDSGQLDAKPFTIPWLSPGIVLPLSTASDSVSAQPGPLALLFFLRLFRHALEAVLHVLHLTAQIVDVVVIDRRLRHLSGSTAVTPPRGGTNGLNIENVC